MNGRISSALVVVALILTACSSGQVESAPKPDTPATSSDKSAVTSSQSGNYLSFEDYKNSKNLYEDSNVVLFFNANWCSTCKIARDNIESNLNSIPSDLSIVVVDFDKEIELRKKYQVTIQHTFVQIDINGNELAKWSGSVTAEEIFEKTI